jgi:hypothetical protein
LDCSDQESLTTEGAERECRPAEVGSRRADLGCDRGELGSRRAEIGSDRAELSGGCAEVDSRRAELRCDRAELGSRRAEVGSHRAELSSGCAEVGSRRAVLECDRGELGSRRAEVGSRRAARLNRSAGSPTGEGVEEGLTLSAETRRGMARCLFAHFGGPETKKWQVGDLALLPERLKVFQISGHQRNRRAKRNRGRESSASPLAKNRRYFLRSLLASSVRVDGPGMVPVRFACYPTPSFNRFFS